MISSGDRNNPFTKMAKVLSHISSQVTKFSKPIGQLAREQWQSFGESTNQNPVTNPLMISSDNLKNPMIEMSCLLSEDLDQLCA